MVKRDGLVCTFIFEFYGYIHPPFTHPMNQPGKTGSSWLQHTCTLYLDHFLFRKPCCSIWFSGMFFFRKRQAMLDECCLRGADWSIGDWSTEGMSTEDRQIFIAMLKQKDRSKMRRFSAFLLLSQIILKWSRGKAQALNPPNREDSNLQWNPHIYHFGTLVLLYGQGLSS